MDTILNRQDHLIGPGLHEFKVQGPLFCPYHNLWGENVYTLDTTFRHNPFTIPASSTSGSPVLLDADGKFFGFMNGEAVDGAEFIYDGGETLTVSVPEGQQLWADESGHSDSWKKYNRVVLESLSPASQIREFWCDIEYCTWVEQKSAALDAGCHAFDVMTHDFVVSYMQRIEEMGLPKGKLTLDHGWHLNDETYGDWAVNKKSFPDLQNTVDLMRENGFIPGLWMAPIWFHYASEVGKKHPEWIGPALCPSTPDSPHVGDWNYFNPLPEVQGHLEEVFARYHAMGFMKFKFDMTYANKQFMKKLHQLIYRAVKNVSQEIEVEIHQPDIFFTTCCDAVRTNDILCNDEYPWWPDLTKAHMEVCKKSAAGRVINLDHIGGNDPGISASTYLRHLELYRNAVGHPVVSMLPDRLGADAVNGLSDYLDVYQNSRNAVSMYY